MDKYGVLKALSVGNPALDVAVQAFAEATVNSKNAVRELLSADLQRLSQKAAEIAAEKAQMESTGYCPTCGQLIVTLPPNNTN